MSAIAHNDIIMPSETAGSLPIVRRIGLKDLGASLRAGWEDFLAVPTHAVFLALIYPIVCIALAGASYDDDTIPLLYPLATGFALIGPFAAIGLYEISRRREAGLDVSPRHALDVAHTPSLYPVIGVGLLLLAIFTLWIASAQAIYVSAFGYRRIESIATFVNDVRRLPEGQMLMIAGNLVGLGFAIVAMCVSVVAFPLLLDRNVGFAAAISTSVRAVLHNPFTMAVWGVIVAMTLLVASAPLFIGLAVAFPVLGHATWHLYRRLIEPDGAPRPEYRPRDRGHRYAADFPAALFSSTHDEGISYPSHAPAADDSGSS